MSKPNSRIRRANAIRKSRSIATSGRACGLLNRSRNTRPCLRSPSRACSELRQTAVRFNASAIEVMQSCFSKIISLFLVWNGQRDC